MELLWMYKFHIMSNCLMDLLQEVMHGTPREPKDCIAIIH